MAKVTGVGKGPEFPPPGEGPKVSGALAHNVGQVDHAAKGAVLYYGSSNLEGRVTSDFADPTAAGPLGADNMLHWKGY